MGKLIILFLLSIFVFLFSASAFAEYMTGVGVYYDSRFYPEFIYDRGGAEGHSGAYVHISAAIDNYDDLKTVNIRAKHMDSDFEVTLREASPECANIWPFNNVDQYYGIRLKPGDWMTGDWEFTLKYTQNGGGGGNETKIITVSRFYFPPEPTGVQIYESQGVNWLAWNRIGDPSITDSRHVECRIMHLDQNSCITDYVAIRPWSVVPDDYRLTSGNRISVPIPAFWQPGDLIRIENRVYGSPDDIVHFGRGTRYVELPLTLSSP